MGLPNVVSTPEMERRQKIIEWRNVWILCVEKGWWRMDSVSAACHTFISPKNSPEGRRQQRVGYIHLSAQLNTVLEQMYLVNFHRWDSGRTV